MSYSRIASLAHLERVEARSTGLNVEKMLPRICGLLIATGLLLYIGLWLFRFYYFAFLACLVVVATFAAQGSVRFAGLGRAALPLFVFFVYQAATLAWSLDFETSFEYYVINLVMPVVFVSFFAIGANSTPTAIGGMFRLLLASCFAAVALSYVVHGGLDVEVTGALRNLIAGLLVFSFVFVLWSYHEQPSIFALPVTVAVLGMALFLGSRAAFVLVPVIFLISMFQLQAGRNRWLRRALVVLSAAAIGIVWLVIYITDPTAIRFDASSFSLDISPEIEREIRLPFDYHVDVERRLMTYSVLEDFLENPIFGTGYMGTLVMTELKYGRPIPGHGIPSLFSEYGLVGVAIFTWAIVHFWKLTRPLPGRYRTFLISCRIAMFAVLAIGLVYQVVELPNFFIVYAIGAGVGIRAAREFRKTHPLSGPVPRPT